MHGYDVAAAPRDAWRSYDRHDPDPGYFEFDWLSARHPDLYHAFALSTLGLVTELTKLVDLTGLVVCDVGAGTGRSALGVAQVAKEVIAVDAYRSVVAFGRERVREEGVAVYYVEGSSARLPLADSSVDVVTCAWAELDFAEAARVVKPGGLVVHMIAAPGGLCGELTPVLADGYPNLAQPPREADWFRADRTAEDSAEQVQSSAIAFVDGELSVHDFSYRADYGSAAEAAAILGRLYGPVAESYLRDRDQATLDWRLRIYYGRVAKS